MKRKTKDLGTETHPGEGVVKEKFPISRIGNLLTGRISGEFWNLRGHQNWKISQKSSQTAITSQEVAHMLAYTGFENQQGLIPGELAKGMWEIKTSLEGLIHRTNLHQVSGQSRSLKST